MRAMGRPRCVLPAHIRPLDIGRTLAGSAFTVTGRRDDSLDPHQTLLQWTALLSQAPPGCVLVIQPHDRELAFMGELSAETLHLRGVRGAIIDGGCRDSDFILRIGFRLFCTHFTPMDIVGRWVATRFDAPVEIGGVAIHAGDQLVADRDGIVVIPQAIAEAVTEETEKVMRTESLVRKAILAGEDPQQAYLKHGKF